MATKTSTMEFLVDQMSAAGEVTSRKMFGEYAVYCDGKVVALVCDDVLYVKPTDAGRAFLDDEVKEGLPYPGAKPYLEISGDRCEDRAWLTELIAVTAAALPEPKKKHR